MGVQLFIMVIHSGLDSALNYLTSRGMGGILCTPVQKYLVLTCNACQSSLNSFWKKKMSFNVLTTSIITIKIVIICVRFLSVWTIRYWAWILILQHLYHQLHQPVRPPHHSKLSWRNDAKLRKQQVCSHFLHFISR